MQQKCVGCWLAPLLHMVKSVNEILLAIVVYTRRLNRNGTKAPPSGINMFINISISNCCCYTYSSSSNSVVVVFVDVITKFFHTNTHTAPDCTCVCVRVSIPETCTCASAVRVHVCSTCWWFIPSAYTVHSLSLPLSTVLPFTCSFFSVSVSLDVCKCVCVRISLWPSKHPAWMASRHIKHQNKWLTCIATPHQRQHVCYSTWSLQSIPQVYTSAAMLQLLLLHGGAIRSSSFFPIILT